MKKTVFVNKPIAVTPLEAIEMFKVKFPEYVNEKISYAGRLDPMAEGLLLLLIGEENKSRNKYEDLNKTYEAEVIFGISTDTFDQLGLVGKVELRLFNKKAIEKVINNFIGKQKQYYPPYSSRTVKGKPLYWWAKNNKLSEIQIPRNEIEILSIKLISQNNISGKDLAENIIKNIKKVNGDFRQVEIINSWVEFKNNFSKNKFIHIKIEVKCTKGTYIRRLASDMGVKIDSCGFAYSIKRTKIGKNTLKDSVYLE